MLTPDPEKSLSAEQLVDELLALPDGCTQKELFKRHPHLLNEQLADELKRQADKYLRSAIDRSLACADLLAYLSELIPNPLVCALGLLAKGNALSIGLGDYRAALAPFAEAHRLFGAHGRPVGQARVEIVRMWALACLGHYEDAFASGAGARTILAEHNEWRLLATATLNLAILHSRYGDEMAALGLYEEADKLYQSLGLHGSGEWLWVQQSRAVSLRNLGRFDEAIAAGQSTYGLLQELGQSAEAARALQNLALTYYVLGRYNEALTHLDEAHDIFWRDGRQSDAMSVELSISGCLLQLRRFQEVLEKCRSVRLLFGELGAQEIVAQAVVNEAVAFTHLGRYEEALQSLQEAQRIFQQVGNQVWSAMTQLETAAVLHRQGNHPTSIQTAQQAIAVFQRQELVVEAAQASLIAAHALLATQEYRKAHSLGEQALATGRDRNLPTLTYQAYQLLGMLAEVDHNDQQALAQYDLALGEVERIRGRLMVEHRANFLEDKQSVYEDAVRLCLAMGQVELGLGYAERAKSRALLDLLTYRLDLSVQARRPEDQALVEELTVLRTQRDRLYRRWEGNEKINLQGWPPAQDEQMHQQAILELEKRITELWHKLLVHNADYARDAALWQVRTEAVQPYLPPDTVLLEYYAIRGELVAFVVTPTGVRAYHLHASLNQAQRLMQLLQMNFNRTPHAAPAQRRALLQNAQGLLRQLYQLLVAPLMPELQPARRLIVVPHGALHYLPFHALYTGDRYLLEQYEFSYLPGASLLRYCTEARPAANGALIYGHSYQGQLPNVLKEVVAIAAVLGERAWLEDELTVEQLQRQMTDCRLLHLATHGDFRADNPLFSGLVVGDGWLTTLDIFNLRLQASLVTLSACQTGRSAVQGGDELAGLMRAFLSAGAASLVLSLWAVEDRSTAQLMQSFYQNLAHGCTKGAALRGGTTAIHSTQILYPQWRRRL